MYESGPTIGSGYNAKNNHQDRRAPKLAMKPEPRASATPGKTGPTPLRLAFHVNKIPISASRRSPHQRDGQTEVGMMEMIAYDDNYTGPGLDPEEGERLAKVLGNKTVLFMANHGITTVGQSVADAYDRLYYIERAAQVQLYAM